MESACFLALPVGFTNTLGQRKDLAAHRFALGFGGVNLGDAGEQQLVDVVHGIGDSGVRADQRAFHAAGAQIRVEERHGTAEEALVLGTSATSRHEEAGTRHHRRFADGAFLERGGDDVAEVFTVKEARAGRGTTGLTQRGRQRDVAQGNRGGFGVDLGKGGTGVVDADGRFDPFADHLHVAFDHGTALGAEFLFDLLAHLVADVLARSPGSDLRHVTGHGTDEGDAHHARGEFRRRCVAFGDGKGVDDEEVDLLLTNGLARLGWQPGPHFFRRIRGLQDEGAAFGEAAQRVGVAEHPVVGRNDDFDVFEFGVGDLDRFRTQGDVEVGRCAALFRTVFRGRLGVHVQHTGQNVGQELAGGDGAVAADRVEAHTEGRIRQEARIGFGFQRHGDGFRVGFLHALLQFGDARGRVLREELRAEVDERCTLAAFHVLEGGNEVAWLQVMTAEAENGGGQTRHGLDRRDAVVAFLIGVFARLEQGLRDKGGEFRLLGTLEHGDALLVGQRSDEFGFGEGLQEFHRDHADLLALAAQVGDDGFDVIGDRADTDHDVIGVVAHIGVHRRVVAASQGRVFVHRLTHQRGNGAGKVGAVVGGTGLEVGLVLHRAGEAGVVHVDQRRDELARAFFESVEPLAFPLALQGFGQPAEGLGDERAVVVLFDLGGVAVEEFFQGGEIGRGKFAFMAGEVLLQLEDTTLGTKQNFLGQSRCLDTTCRVAKVFTQ